MLCLHNEFASKKKVIYSSERVHWREDYLSVVYLIVIPDTSRGLLQKSDHKRGMIMKSSSLLRMKSARVGAP